MDTPTPTSLDPKFREPLPHMGWGGIIDLVTYGPMGYRRRSWGWRTTWKRSYPRGTNSLGSGSVAVLLIAGLFTWGFAWLILLVWACVEAGRPPEVDFRTRMNQLEAEVDASSPDPFGLRTGRNT